MTKLTRTEFLRKSAQDTLHKQARIALPSDWSTAQLECSLPERKAYAIKMMLEKMPLYIGEQELIVGSRTIYGHKNEEQDQSDMGLIAMPHYIHQADVDYFKTNGENYTKGHYTCGYERLLSRGIGGITREVKAAIGKQKDPDKVCYLNSILIAYEGLSELISRYASYAGELAKQESSPKRQEELLKISKVCANIVEGKPSGFYEATQLFWFSHLSVIVENFIFMNYGRVDQFLYPFYQKGEDEITQQLVDCLLLKMYDGLDILDSRTGNYAGQHNITLGGVTRTGEDAVNQLSYLFIDGLSRTRFPEPEVSVRINSKNPRKFLRKCAELSVSGLNCIAYYNDDQFIRSMVAVGISQENANDYGFDLCQDINIPGRGDFYTSGGVDLTLALLEAMRQCEEPACFEELLANCKKQVGFMIQQSLEGYNEAERAIREYADGNKQYAFDAIESHKISASSLSSLMSPLPLTSALYYGCVETGRDLSWFGCELEDRGYMVANIVVALNSLAALRKVSFDEKKYTVKEILVACDHNFEGQEILRQELWNAPKWGNDDDYVDLPAKELIEFACDEIMKYKTPNGAMHLAGIHQPHPVFAGELLGATPEGRKAGSPIPVTLSPENGTMLNGPLAAFRSAAKIDPMKYQWNNCVMLQYFSTVFESNEGVDLFSGLLTQYFSINGAQHQPNVVNVGDLKKAQANPQAYRDLIVRMWGVSAHFVTLPKDVQDEFIARFENIP